MVFIVFNLGILGDNLPINIHKKRAYSGISYRGTRFCKVADLSPLHFRKQAATDGTKLDLNIGETRVWRLYNPEDGGLFVGIFWDYPP